MIMEKSEMTHKSFTVDVYTNPGFYCAEVSYPSPVSEKEKVQIMAGSPWSLSKKLQEFFEKEADLLSQQDREKYLSKWL